MCFPMTTKIGTRKETINSLVVCRNMWLMEQHIFAFSLIIEGTAEKVLQFMMPLNSIYNRNFGFIEQKMYFLTLQRVSSKKISGIIFAMKKNFC
jgi:hypothetical protein